MMLLVRDDKKQDSAFEIFERNSLQQFFQNNPTATLSPVSKRHIVARRDLDLFPELQAQYAKYINGLTIELETLTAVSTPAP